MTTDPQNPTSTVIGPDTHIKGEMTFNSNARILGNFEGRITAKGELQISDGATCKASVEASRVVLDGSIEGNVVARERFELSSKAKMKGDLVAAKLVIAEGATFVGHCSVGPEAAANAKPADGGYALPEPKIIHHHKPDPRLEPARR